MTINLNSEDWWLRNMCQIVPASRKKGQGDAEEMVSASPLGVVPFILRGEQEEFLRNIHPLNFIPKARKIGFSTLLVLRSFIKCIREPNTLCAHVDFSEKKAFQKLDIARVAWNAGPRHPNPMIAELWAMIHEELHLVADNKSCLEWSNGSKQEAGASFMGGTPRELHISEFGPLAAQRPKDAELVIKESLNAVEDGVVTIETTMEGGRFGECYSIFDAALEAMKLPPEDFTDQHWRFHFFPWYTHPSYDAPGRVPRKEETIRYFAELHRNPWLVERGVTIPLSRQAWYEGKKRTQKDHMWTQYPSEPSECIRTVVAGAIYPIMTTLRAKGRIKDISPARDAPLFTHWDIGISDFMAGWLSQFSGPDRMFHDRFEAEGATAGDVVRQIIAWEEEHGQRIAFHLFPHDAERRAANDGLTFRQAILSAAKKYPGCSITERNIMVVPVTKDIWQGINAVRDKVLPNAWFHPRCDAEREQNGVKHPSGVACLEGYRKQAVTANGAVKEDPMHDACSHTADAMRTCGEAFERGMIQGFRVATTPAPRAERDRGGRMSGGPV